MGINSLHKFLKKHCPDVYQVVPLSELSGKTIAVDVSIYICKYKTVYHDKWLFYFIKLISCMLRNNIRAVMIYDTGCVPEKSAERKARWEKREKQEQKIAFYEVAIERYKETGEMDPELINLYNKRSHKRLLGEWVDVKVLENIVGKMKKNILYLTQKDFDVTKQLLGIIGMQYYNAPMEAETMCSDLCKRGKVFGVLSEDTDVIAYGAPVFLSRIDIMNECCTLIRHGDILRHLELSESEFLDFCIMCGTDYNKNIFRVGPDKSYKYIKQHRTLDRVSSDTSLDTSVLNFQRVREIFTDYEKKDVEPYWQSVPNFQDLSHFARVNNIFIAMDGLKSLFVKKN